MRPPPLWVLVLTWLIPIWVFVQQPESSVGTLPLPQIVGMSGDCPGIVIASGTLNAKTDELDQSSVAIGAAMLFLHPDGVPWQTLRGRMGEAGDLVWRPTCVRKLQELKR